MCDFITLSALPKLILQIDSFFTLHRRTAPRTARRQEQILPLLEQILSVRCHACTAARTAGAASSAPLLGAAFSASPNFAVPCPSAVPSHTRTAGCGHTPRTTCAGRAGPHAPPPRRTCHHGTRVPQTLPAGAAPRARELDTACRSQPFCCPPGAVLLPTARLGFQSASVCVREHEWHEGNALARVVALPPAARSPPGSFLEYFQVRDVRSAATCCCRSRCQLARGAQCAHVRTPHARAARSRARARVDGALAERVHHYRMQVRPGCTPRVRDHRAAAALANPKQAADRYAN